MNYLTADASVCDFFRGVLSPVEIRDEGGNLLGTFTPNVPPEVLQQYEKARKLIDPADLRRRAEAEKGQGVPLAEVWRRIEAGELPR